MYGINGYGDEDDLRQLLGFKMPEEVESYQAQAVPQLSQGLLGNVEQNQPQLLDKVSDVAAQMAKVAQSANQNSGGDDLAQRQASTQQLAQQALAQKQQQQQQSGQILGKLLKMYLSGGMG